MQRGKLPGTPSIATSYYEAPCFWMQLEYSATQGVIATTNSTSHAIALRLPVAGTETEVFAGLAVLDRPAQEAQEKEEGRGVRLCVGG